AAATPTDRSSQRGPTSAIARDGADYRPSSRSDHGTSASAFGSFSRRAARCLASQFLALGKVAVQGVFVHVPAGIHGGRPASVRGASADPQGDHADSHESGHNPPPFDYVYQRGAVTLSIHKDLVRGRGGSFPCRGGRGV